MRILLDFVGAVGRGWYEAYHIGILYPISSKVSNSLSFLLYSEYSDHKSHDMGEYKLGV